MPVAIDRGAPSPSHLLLYSVLGLLLATSATASDNHTMNPERLLAPLVNTNTGTRNVAGLNRARSLLVPEFETLGYETTTYRLPEGRQVVSFQFPGTKPDIMLLGQIDTVFPAESPLKKLRIEGGKVFGPGVIDMKGGITLILDILARLDTKIRRQIRIVLNDDEEIGSPFTLPTLRELAGGMRFGLVFEPGLADGALVTSQSGVVWLDLEVTGKEAHAGLEPEKGINACVELSHKVVSLAALTDYKRTLTVNTGVLRGGTKPNVVCKEALARIDVRYVDPQDLETLMQRIREIAMRMTVRNPDSTIGLSAKLKEIVTLPSLTSKNTSLMYEETRKAAQRLGQTITGRHVGYASNANQLADTGVELLVGLGPYGGGMHTDQEFMSIAAYEKRLQLGIELIRSLTRSR